MADLAFESLEQAETWRIAQDTTDTTGTRGTERKLMTTRVVNKKKEPYDVYIGRGSPFGNEWSHLPISKAKHRVPSRGDSIWCYEQWFLLEVENNLEFRKLVLRLKGKVLGCTCKPKSCHGDVIAAWVDNICGDLHGKSSVPENVPESLLDVD